MLEIQNLHATIEGREILRVITLKVNAGEVHAIMGPNGSGKSTLAQLLAGREGYDVTGEVRYDGKDLLAMPPEERAVGGIFLAFQYPIEIPGVGNLYFLRTALNTIRRPSRRCPRSFVGAPKSPRRSTSRLPISHPRFEQRRSFTSSMCGHARSTR